MVVFSPLLSVLGGFSQSVAEKQVEGQKRSVDVEGRISFYIETSGFKGFYNMFHVNILNQSLSKGLMA